MSKVTPEKTHALLEKLTDYVTSKMATKEDVNNQITDVNNRLSSVDSQFDTVNNKIDKLAEYVMNKVPIKQEMNYRFEQVENQLGKVEGDVKLILNGMDNQVKDMEILRTEQIAIHSGLRRLEIRVDGIESA